MLLSEKIMWSVVALIGPNLALAAIGLVTGSLAFSGLEVGICTIATFSALVWIWVIYPLVGRSRQS